MASSVYDNGDLEEIILESGKETFDFKKGLFRLFNPILSILLIKQESKKYWYHRLANVKFTAGNVWCASQIPHTEWLLRYQSSI